MELYLHSPDSPSWRGAQFKIAQGKLYLLPLPLTIFGEEYRALTHSLCADEVLKSHNFSYLIPI
jgi:hypothetical protein